MCKMYGGLFGDLPAAKSESKSTAADDTSNKTPQQPPAAANEKGQSAATIEQTNDAGQKRTVSIPSMFMPQAARKKPKPAAKSTASISKAIGKAGTSMAFIPNTVRKRPQQKTTKVPVKVEESQPQQESKPPASTPSSSGFSHSASHLEIVRKSTAATSTGPIDIHGQHRTDSTNEPPSHPRVPTPEMSQPSFLATIPNDAVEDILDPYDPRVPNDLLKFRELQLIEQERQRAHEEAQQALEDQRVLREQLEEERRKLYASGEISQLASASSSGMGRGRGRGVSNLPAWLVAQQEREKSDSLG